MKEHAGKKFTAREIAAWFFANYAEECRDKEDPSKNKFITTAPKGEEKDKAIINALAAEINGERKYSIHKQEQKVKVTEDRPRKFYYTESTDFEEVEFLESEEIWNSGSDEKPSERQLYPKLSEFLWGELQLHSKRIDEKGSSNSQGPKGNHWLYPDIVALADLSADWEPEVKICVKEYAG